MGTELQTLPNKISLPSNVEKRWKVTLYDNQSFFITEEEKEYIIKSVKEDSAIINLGRAFFKTSAISSIIYRGIDDENYRESLDPYANK